MNNIKLDGRMIVNFDYEGFEDWLAQKKIKASDICTRMGYNSSYFSNCKTRNRMKLATYKWLLSMYELPENSFILPEPTELTKEETAYVENDIDATDEFYVRTHLKRGWIYKVVDRKKGTDKGYPSELFLILSPDTRNSSKFVHGLFLGERDNTDYDDIVKITDRWSVSVDRLTYIVRHRIVEEKCPIPDDMLETIDEKIRYRLGL